MSEKKSYKVSIFGETYSLLSDELEEHIKGSARLVDHYIQEIASKLPAHSRDTQAKTCAVLAALQIASDLLKKENQQKRYQKKQQDLAKWIDQELLLVSQ